MLVKFTFLIYTEPGDDLLVLWENAKKRYPECLWDVCMERGRLWEQVEGKDVVFLDGGYIGTDDVGQAGIATSIERYVEDTVDGHPGIEFVITGGLACRWYQRLGWSPKHNTDYVAAGLFE